MRQITQCLFILTVLCVAHLAGLSTTARAQSASDGDYVCDDDECEAVPLSREGPLGSEAQKLGKFLKDQPGFISKPVDTLRSLLADDFALELFGHTFTAGLSGRVNRALLYGDNQDENEVFLVDNNNSSTQIVGVAELPMNDNWLLGGRIKLPIIFNSSLDVDFGDGGIDFSFGEFGEGELGGYIVHAEYGKFYFGYGSTASDGTSETDLSGMTVISRSRVRDLAGGLSFAPGGPKIRDVFANFDGLGDDSRMRYDSPRIANALWSVSLTSSGDIDFAARWEKRIDDRRIAAAASIVEYEDGKEQASISFSTLWESGFNISGVASGQLGEDRDPYFLYAKFGWFATPFEIGNTAFGFDLAYNDSVRRPGDKAASVGAFVVQSIDRDGIIYAVDLFGGIRLHHLETDEKNYDDILATMIGFRVRF